METFENMLPTLDPDADVRVLPAEFRELDGIKVKAPVGLYGTFSEDGGFSSRVKPGGGTNLFGYNRGVAVAQRNLELSRLRGPLRNGNTKEGDDVTNLYATSLGHDVLKPDLGLLTGYPQRILVNKLRGSVMQW